LWRNFEPAVANADVVPVVPDVVGDIVESDSDQAAEKIQSEKSDAESMEQEEPEVDLKAQLLALRKTLNVRPIKGNPVSWSTHFKRATDLFHPVINGDSYLKFFKNWCDQIAGQEFDLSPLVFLYHLNPGNLFFSFFFFLSYSNKS
jgi:hypothetical protein